MEDALISPLGFAILSGAGIVDSTGGTTIPVHTTSNVVAEVKVGNTIDIDLNTLKILPQNGTLNTTAKAYGFVLDQSGQIKTKLGTGTTTGSKITFSGVDSLGLSAGEQHTILLDYYIDMNSGVTQLEVTPDKFAGYYYLEASTLFRRQDTGADVPAQFIIPSVKIQSAFTFAMAATGDPSTFTFTMDAFPDYTKFDRTKKVLFALQIVEDFQPTTYAMPFSAGAQAENVSKK